MGQGQDKHGLRFKAPFASTVEGTAGQIPFEGGPVQLKAGAHYEITSDLETTARIRRVYWWERLLRKMRAAWHDVGA